MSFLVIKDVTSDPLQVGFFRARTVVADANYIIMLIEYEDMAAYGARTVFETSNADWLRLFAATPDAPERLASVELLSEL